MESLYLNIADRYSAELTGISLIDEDLGQLEAILNGEDQYPVTFPCLLISIPQTDWRTLCGRDQQGTLNVTVKLAFDCYDDTHAGSGTEYKCNERAALNHEAVKLLNFYRFESCDSAFIRTQSRQYTLPGNIKVYETTYTVKITDKSE